MSEVNTIEQRVSAIESEMASFRENVGVVVDGVSTGQRRVNECMDSVETLLEDRRRLQELVDNMAKVLTNHNKAIVEQHELMTKLATTVQLLRREVDIHRSKLGVKGKLGGGTLN